ETVTTVYRMNPPGGPTGPGNPALTDFLARYGIPADQPPPQPGGPGAVTGTPQPPPPGGPTGAGAASGLNGMGAVPTPPGDQPRPSVDGPSVTPTQLTDSQWQPVDNELRTQYGFNADEAAAFRSQYGSRNLDQLRSDGILPQHDANSPPLDGPPPLTGTARTA